VPRLYKELADWKAATPNDSAPHGPWWEVFRDPLLSHLEQQVNVSNQNIAASFASYLAAKALVKEARSQYFPTLTAAPSTELAQQPTFPGAAPSKYFNYSVPVDASWAPDLWGRVRNAVQQNVASAQVSAADLENTRLTEQADLAITYYELRGQDSMMELFDATVKSYRTSLELTQSLYKTGIDSQESVVQAETNLRTAEAQATGLAIARAQYEHAIAMLIGLPPGDFSIPKKPLEGDPPVIPVDIPSRLLERRPDIAAAERSMAAANAQIGVGIAAYYPALTLTGSAGFGFAGLTSLPALIWSLGASLSQFIYDGGLRGATVEQYKASYLQAVANYRQTVLTAFEQVEDALATLRISAKELQQQEVAVKASAAYVRIATDRYQTGVDPYLNVQVAQISLLTNEQTAVTLRMQLMTGSVQLVEALGGGWDATKLPGFKEVDSKTPKDQLEPDSARQ
jgi:NodT family efflux transporter outer membrane factor (OMF) lipoprotein